MNGFISPSSEQTLWATKKQAFDRWIVTPPGRARFGRVVWAGGRSADRVFSSPSTDMVKLLLQIKVGEAVDVLDSSLMRRTGGVPYVEKDMANINI